MDHRAVHHPLLRRLHLRRLEVHRLLARALGHPRTRALRGLNLAAIAGLAAVLAGCADTRHLLVVDVRQQKLTVLDKGVAVATYPVSTSKFGLGDEPGSNRTPVGKFRIRRKIGTGAPAGMVFKDRRPTGEVLSVDAPGRDPIVTRILWLDGLEPHNRNAYNRYIYIHGTPEERNIGLPVSYGCIRMRSRDIIALYERVGTGARVQILTGGL